MEKQKEEKKKPVEEKHNFSRGDAVGFS